MLDAPSLDAKAKPPRDAIVNRSPVFYGWVILLAAASYAPVAITSAAANLASGFLVDRVRLLVLMAVALLLQALSLWMVSTWVWGWRWPCSLAWRSAPPAASCAR